MFNRTRFPLAILAASAALLLGTAPSHAQTGGAGSSSSGKATASQLSSEDREVIEDLAHAHLAEIETGKMALEKGQSDQVKKFAQMMIDDHTTALKELQTLAQSKGMTLPNETDLQHKTIATALKVLSGETFDKQYIARVGVGDHQRTYEMLQKVQKNAKDPALKAYAQKTMPIVGQHLDTAKKMENRK